MHDSFLEEILRELAEDLRNIREYFDRSTSVLTEEDAGFAPAPGAFTAAQQIAHVAQTIEWFFRGAFAEGGFSMDFDAMDREVRAVKTLAEARQWLDRAFAEGDDVYADRIGEIRCPLLVLTADGDPNSTPAMAWAIAEMAPRARVVVIEGHRHLVPLTASDAVNAELRRWLAVPESVE